MGIRDKLVPKTIVDHHIHDLDKQDGLSVVSLLAEMEKSVTVEAIETVMTSHRTHRRHCGVRLCRLALRHRRRLNGRRLFGMATVTVGFIWILLDSVARR